MKKTSFLALAAMMSLASQAQYTVDPSNKLVLDQKPASLSYILLSEGAINEFTEAGTKLNYVGPDETSNFLYYWDNTVSNGDSSYPRVDLEEGGYLSLVVGTAGWSGAGFCNTQPTNLGQMDENTRFHIAYMSPTGNAPASIALILLDGDDGICKPAKISLGAGFEDNGAVFPAVGPKAGDDWQGVDISFADLKKLFPSFDWSGADKFKGNLFSFLGGGVAGTTFAFDAVYFYNIKASDPSDSGVESVEAVSKMVVSGETINVAAGQGVELYNLGGQLVRETNGCVLGLNGLQKGVYVAKSGREVRKIVIR